MHKSNHETMIYLTRKELIDIESSQDFSQRNLPKQVEEYKEILDTLMLLQEYLVKSKVNIPSYKIHIDTLISKTIFHSNILALKLNPN